MDLATFRKSVGLSQQELGELLDLASKGHVSDIENGEVQPHLRLALKIERVSNGLVSAYSLVSKDDADLLREAIVRAGGHVPAEAQPA
jgi:transcriptional regulator with XRE-family HTH domain